MNVYRNEKPVAGNTDTSFLKLLALLLMLIDHIGVIFFPRTMEWRIVGRMAFPLYAWCLVVGSVKTRSLFKYELRLLLLAIISQPLYMMALNHGWSDLGILYTLLVSLIALHGIRVHRFGSQLWVPALCYVLLGFIKVDYGWKGMTFILLLYLARESKTGLAAAFIAYALYWGASSSAVTSILGYRLTFLSWPGLGPVLSAFFRLQGMMWLSLPLVVFSTRTGVMLPQWLGYAVYPLHLVLLIVLRLMNGATFAMLTSGF